jgi:hypothetical protein
MIPHQKKLAVALGALILISGVFFVIASLEREMKEKATSTQPASTVLEDSVPRVYTDDALHFSMEVPPRITDIEKMGQGIVFGESPDGPWIIGVSAELTPYDTTEDWLNAQPKVSASSRGYELIRWIGAQTDGKVLVAEYVGPGLDGSTYGKRLFMMTVKNGSLYTMYIDTWNEADAVLTVDPDIERALETFQATGLVTTDSTGSYRTIQNWECGATIHIPPDWSDHGLLGGSKILSPEDERINEEWANANQELFQNAEGDGPIGPDARSLYISCQYNVVREDLKSTSLKTIKINGRNAFEVADTGKMPDGTSVTNYKIILEGPKVMEIYLGQTEYDNLSETVKQIIQSISFE